MAGTREYPPASQIHRPDCPVIPAPLAGVTLATAQIARQHPNAVMHNCYHFHRNPRGVVEPVFYPPHEYAPSASFPDDATRPLCVMCRGTHQGEDVGSPLRVAGGGGLILPGKPAAGQVILPGNA